LLNYNYKTQALSHLNLLIATFKCITFVTKTGYSRRPLTSSDQNPV